VAIEREGRRREVAKSGMANGFMVFQKDVVTRDRFGGVGSDLKTTDKKWDKERQEADNTC
jgi:hypothetical protein